MAVLRLYGRAGAARGIGVKNSSHQNPSLDLALEEYKELLYR